MTSKKNGRVEIGDLVVTAFDEAAQQIADPEQISRLATRVITFMLQHARRSASTSVSEPTTP